MRKNKGEKGEVSRRDFLITAGSVVVGGAIGAGITYPLVAGREKEVVTTKTVEITKTVTSPGQTVTITAPGATATVTTTAPGATITKTVEVPPAKVELEILDPSGAFEVTVLHAPRLDTLAGKTIGELCMEWQCWRTFEYMRPILQSMYPTAKFIPWTALPRIGGLDEAGTQLAPVVEAVRAAGCDAVIVGNAG